MRIAFVSSLTGAPWAGCEELWGGAASRLLEGSHTLAVCVKYWPRLARQVLDLEKRGAEVFTWRTEHDHFFYKMWSELDWRERKDFRRLRRFRPDLVVISQGSHTDGLQWMKFCRDEGLPFVAIVHTNMELWWLGDCSASELGAAYLAACRVFCVSRHSRELLEWQIGDLLPNARHFWNPYKTPPVELPAWPQGNAIRLACVARLDPGIKGHDLLMRVMALPRWRERPVELHLYGGFAPYENVLRKMAARLELKNVFFHGHVDDVNSIWKTNHIFIMPSRFEGMPIVLVETMFNARAAIVTDVGGNGELCADGETGFLVPAPTVGFLDETLERAWSQRDRWQAMGQAALARVQKLVPADPVGEFCSQLMECISGK